MNEREKSTSVDAYIRSCPPEYRERLTELRNLILACAPDAREKISYGIPTYVLNGNLIHFGIAKKHIGLYPGSSGILQFEHLFIQENLKYSKGTVQFPHDRPLPVDLIQEIVRFRVREQG